MSLLAATPIIDDILALDESANPTVGEANFVLYGAGNLGKFTILAMRQAGMAPLAICDSNPRLWGESCEGVEIMAIDKAMLVHPHATFVVTIYTGAEMRRKLRGIGLKVASFAQLYRAHLLYRNGTILPYGSHCDLRWMRGQAAAIQIGHGLWADVASREEYEAQLRYRITLDDACLPPSLSPDQIYFPPEIPWKDRDCFWDCGACDGDTVAAFLKRRPDFNRDKDSIVAFEPDRENVEKFKANRNVYPQTWFLYQAAVSDRTGQARFNARGDAGSSLDGGGDDTVSCITIDDALLNNCHIPTRLKMDIEGGELAALRGASRTLKAHKPALAICLYHKAQDLWEIPTFLKSLVPDYDLFLRRYSEDCWELVCYAVPKV